MFEDIGVAGVCIEDVEPAYKQNSLWGDRVPLMEIKDFIKKINIPNRKIKIIARTEALIRKYGYKEAIERACCYFSAGADYILIHTRDETGKEIKEISKHSYLPLSIAPTKCPYYTNKELYEMGYSMIIWANQTERTKIRAVRDMLYQLKQNDRMLEAEEHLCATLEDMKGLMP
jgi:phosphoenolpyruvate phosphomutase